MFGTSHSRPQSASNVRNRVLAPAVNRANERLAEEGEVLLPERLSPHKVRHTFASLLVALGVDPGSVMDQLGHTDPTFTLRVYRHGMRRDEQSKRALRELVGLNGQPPDWAASGTVLSRWPLTRFRHPCQGDKTLRVSGAFVKRARQDLNLRPFAPEARLRLLAIRLFPLQSKTNGADAVAPKSADFGPIWPGLAP
ncbi:MAG: tyrosine-type recombinase/integrase [Solirubrobacteraceae bacterium]